MTILAIDPGRKAGTGLALISPRFRQVVASGHGKWSAAETVAHAVVYPETVIAIEIMTPMGAAKFNAGMLANAQFVGEIIGHCRERGLTVVEVTKREALLAIGCKGKAPASRVRRCVAGIFPGAEKLNVHELDAVAVGWAAWLKMRARRVA